MFVILQKYDFSSKSQLSMRNVFEFFWCLWYCKSTIFQANHNSYLILFEYTFDVCDTAKVRFFKQITTDDAFQPLVRWCLWYCKSTIFQANHNSADAGYLGKVDVCDTAKVRFFKQITTETLRLIISPMMFVILQKYDFSSKSQPHVHLTKDYIRCLWYCKSTIFQANHNGYKEWWYVLQDVCDTAKVRFFKQITTRRITIVWRSLMFVILQKYDFSSKSQRAQEDVQGTLGCLWYCKSTIFQANHNDAHRWQKFTRDVCDTAKVRFFKQITTMLTVDRSSLEMFVILQKYDFSSKSQPKCIALATTPRCLWYCKSTIFQANHNARSTSQKTTDDVCDTAKVRFFKQITTNFPCISPLNTMFVILQKYDFSSKSQQIYSNQSGYQGCLWYCKSTIFQANHNGL